MRFRISVLGAGSLLFVVLSGCGRPPPQERRPDSEGEINYIPVVPLTNEEFSITEMANAHGALTVEVEVDLAADTASIARRLVEPVRDGYAEILVYFYDRAGDGDLPISRVQWTPEGGYVEIEY